MSRIIAVFLYVCVLPTAIHAQNLTVTGAGDADSNGLYVENGSANSKPKFDSKDVGTVFIEWDGSQWILYNTATGFTNYTNPLDTPLPPDHFWQEAKLSGPPTLSGERVSYPLAGVYTVGGASPDFATIKGAVDSLNNHGIFNDVTFAIRPGTYDEQVTINAFPRYGSSSDSVAFMPESGTVDWSFTSAGAANNWFARIDGADHVTFDGIDFNVPAGTPSYGTIIVLGNVEDLLIKNCSLDGRPNAPDGFHTLVNYSGTNTDVAVVDSEISNGYIGVRLPTNAIVARSTFIQQEVRGIDIPVGQSARVFDNTVTDWVLSSSTYIGIDVTGVMAQVDRNTVRVGNGATGIEVDGSGTKVRNNMITMYSTAAIAGIYLHSNATNQVLFNTVLVLNSAAGVPLATSSMPSQFIVISNIFYNSGGGPTITADLSDMFSDYNDLYTTGPLLVTGYSGGSFATLVDWHGYNAQDLHSASKSVDFISTSAPHDLHLTGASVGDADLAGFLFGDVTIDIDGDTRSTLAPYMGADEAAALNTGYELTLQNVVLEGPKPPSGPMSTALNSAGYLEAHALNHPYSGPPWNHDGNESVPSGFFAANPTVVDWVLVRLFSGDINSVITPDVAVAGLVDHGGEVMSTSGDTYLTFTPSKPGDYYVAVYHRNHVGAILANPITIEYPGSTSSTIAFSNTQKFGTNPVSSEGLWACDANADGIVTAPDFNLWNASTTAGETGYRAADCNMDGIVTAPDFNLWNANTTAGAASQIPD